MDRLNSTLFKIGKHNPGRCEYCGGEETVEHQKYEAERRHLIQNLRKIIVHYDSTKELKK